MTEYYKLDESKPVIISQKAVIIDGGKFLFLKGSPAMGGKWELPGGLLETEENLELGLKREVKEETGLDIKVFKLLGVFEDWHKGFKLEGGKIIDAHFIILIFLCGKEPGEIKLSDEHEKFMWFGRADLDKFEFGDKTIKSISLLKDVLARQMPLS